MDTRGDTASEPAVAAVVRRGGPDWGHLPHSDLTNLIIGAGFEVHNVLGTGFLEAVYTNALTVELRHRSVPVERNVVFEVVYRRVSVGRYVADLVVDRRVIVETRVAKAIDRRRRSGSGMQPMMNRESTTARQRQDLTRMNHDQHDDADLLREHQPSRPRKTLLWF